MTLLDALLELGFSKLDIALLVLCPVAALLGSLVHMFIVENDFSQMPKMENGQSISELNNASILLLASWFSIPSKKRWYWIWGRAIIGVTVGVLVALYFAGAINPGSTNTAKVLALAVLAGYLAPKLFIAQDKALTQAIEQKLLRLIDESVERTKPP